MAWSEQDYTKAKSLLDTVAPDKRAALEAAIAKYEAEAQTDTKDYASAFAPEKTKTEKGLEAYGAQLPKASPVAPAREEAPGLGGSPAEQAVSQLRRYREGAFDVEPIQAEGPSEAGRELVQGFAEQAQPPATEKQRDLLQGMTIDKKLQSASKAQELYRPPSFQPADIGIGELARFGAPVVFREPPLEEAQAALEPEFGTWVKTWDENSPHYKAYADYKYAQVYDDAAQAGIPIQRAAFVESPSKLGRAIGGVRSAARSAERGMTADIPRNLLTGLARAFGLEESPGERLAEAEAGSGLPEAAQIGIGMASAMAPAGLPMKLYQGTSKLPGMARLGASGTGGRVAREGLAGVGTGVTETGLEAGGEAVAGKPVDDLGQRMLIQSLLGVGGGVLPEAIASGASGYRKMLRKPADLGGMFPELPALERAGVRTDLGSGIKLTPGMEEIAQRAQTRNVTPSKLLAEELGPDISSQALEFAEFVTRRVARESEEATEWARKSGLHGKPVNMVFTIREAIRGGEFEGGGDLPFVQSDWLRRELNKLVDIRKEPRAAAEKMERESLEYAASPGSRRVDQLEGVEIGDWPSPEAARFATLTMDEARAIGIDVDSIKPSRAPKAEEVAQAKGTADLRPAAQRTASPKAAETGDEYMIVLEAKSLTPMQIDRMSEDLFQMAQREGVKGSLASKLHAAVLRDRDIIGRYYDGIPGTPGFISPERMADASEYSWGSGVIGNIDPTTGELRQGRNPAEYHQRPGAAEFGKKGEAGVRVKRTDPVTNKEYEVGGYSAMKTGHEEELSDLTNVLQSINLPDHLRAAPVIEGRGRTLYQELGGPKSTDTRRVPKLNHKQQEALWNAIENPSSELGERTVEWFATDAGVTKKLNTMKAMKLVNQLRSRFGEDVPRVAASRGGMTAFLPNAFKKAMLRADRVAGFLAPLQEELTSAGLVTPAGQIAPELKRFLGWSRRDIAPGRDTIPTPMTIAELSPVAGLGRFGAAPMTALDGPENVVDLTEGDAQALGALLDAITVNRDKQDQMDEDDLEKALRGEL